MIQQTYHLEFITPCFCAGADQSVAEIRAPSIRGQLRWWFRVLGGSRAEEKSIFGGIHGKTSASQIVIRTKLIKLGKEWTPPSVNQNDPSSYVWYFASISGKKQKGPGPRWNSSAVIPPGSQWEMTIIHKVPPCDKLTNAIQCFLLLGGLGLRVTRGLGAFDIREYPFSKNFSSLEPVIKHAGIRTERMPLNVDNIKKVIDTIGSYVKGTRHSLRLKSDRPSVLGSSTPRQTSAVYFRPILNDLRNYDLIIFEAPSQKILDTLASKSSPITGCSPSKFVQAERGSRGIKW